MCTRFDSAVNSHTSTLKLVTTLPYLQAQCSETKRHCLIRTMIKRPKWPAKVLFILLITYTSILPLDVDSINENDSVANPDPTPRTASVHKFRIAEVVLVGCWMEAVYYGLLLFTIT